MLCAHNVASTGSYGKTMRSIVFMDSDGDTYIWITTAGQEFEEGQFYDITAKCNTRKILSYVKILKDYSIPDQDGKESEQPDRKDPIDVFDLIFSTDSTDDTPLTND